MPGKKAVQGRTVMNQKSMRALNIKAFRASRLILRTIKLIGTNYLMPGQLKPHRQ